MGLPFAMKNGGLYAGILSMIFLAIVSTYCIHILVECKRFCQKRVTEDHVVTKNIFSYSDIGNEVYGKTGKFVFFFFPHCDISISQQTDSDLDFLFVLLD